MRGRYPPLFVLPDPDPVPSHIRLPRLRSGTKGARALQIPIPPFPRTPPSLQHVFPNPFTVIPSEAEGPETVAHTNSIVPEHHRNLYPVVPGKPGTHLFSSCRTPIRYPATFVFPDSDRGPKARGRFKSQHRRSRAPHRHSNMSSRTLSLSSRAKPRDLRRSPTLTALFTNTTGTPTPSYRGNPVPTPFRLAGPRSGTHHTHANHRRTPSSTKTQRRGVGTWAPIGGRARLLLRTRDPCTNPVPPPSCRGNPVPAHVPTPLTPAQGPNPPLSPLTAPARRAGPPRSLRRSHPAEVGSPSPPCSRRAARRCRGSPCPASPGRRS